MNKAVRMASSREAVSPDRWRINSPQALNRGVRRAGARMPFSGAWPLLRLVAGALLLTCGRGEAQTLAGTNTSTLAFQLGTNLTATPANLSAYVPDDKYKLRLGDKVSLQILEDKEPPRPLVVADSGELDIPYIGRVAAENKTCKAVAAQLKTELEKEYYYRATVILALDTANKLLGHVYVWGDVKTQGPIDLNVGDNLTASKAILRAGGFGDFADKKHVKVIRAPGPRGGAKQILDLNMQEILEEGKTEKDVLLQPDDNVSVKSKPWNL